LVNRGDCIEELQLRSVIRYVTSGRGRKKRKKTTLYIYILKMNYVSKYVPECVKQIPVYMVRF